MGVDTAVLNYQIPGGMISNLTSQLASQNASHLLGEVLQEVPRVRAELGYPPLVTPSSQIVGTQAVMNVITGGRYKVILTEVKNYLKGLYGRPPGEVDPDLLKKVLKDEEPFKGRPADLLEPQLETTRKEMKGFLEKEEDLLSCIIFPQVAEAFFKERKGVASPSVNNPGPRGNSKSRPAGNITRASQSGELHLDKLYTIDENLVYNDDDEKKGLVYPTA
jgi:pyruvate/oxaloacetate carboxyltransferase